MTNYTYETVEDMIVTLDDLKHADTITITHPKPESSDVNEYVIVDQKVFIPDGGSFINLDS